jgi:hypothetical protein
MYTYIPSDGSSAFFLGNIWYTVTAVVGYPLALLVQLQFLAA